MRRATFLAIVFSLILGSTAMAANSPTVKFEHKTSANLPLTFTPQKVKWKRETIRIWGVVKNTGPSKYKFVSVSFTCLDKNREFLGRFKTYVDPHDLDSGEEGNIDNLSLDSDEKLPAIIQIKVASGE